MVRQNSTSSLDKATVEFSSDDLVPLCVDLDSTLITSDSLFESVFKLAKTKPWILALLPFWIAKGMAYTKSRLVSYVSLEPASLPYHKDLFFYLKRMAKRGRPIFLVTGANQKIADDVATYLGIFKKVYASSASVNLIGATKAQLLQAEFGNKGFDYVGDSNHDFAVWKLARKAVVVNNSVSFQQKVRSVATVDKIFTTGRPLWLDLVQAIRPHQWAKNALIVLPLFLAHSQLNWWNLLQVAQAFFAFSFVASAIYVINDLSDLDADRQHHEKSNRPFASGRLHLGYAALIVPVCLSLAASFAWVLPTKFIYVLLGYGLLTNLYTFFFKRIAVADIVLLASLYSIRLLAGGAVSSVHISPWLVAFSGFFFVSLALIKRYSELLNLKSSGKVKAAGRGYDVVDLPVLVSLGTAAGYASVLVLALYINSGVAREHYRSDFILWLLCPLLMYWISRVWLIANRGKLDSDPVKFALKDVVSWVCLSIAAVIWLLAS